MSGKGMRMEVKTFFDVAVLLHGTKEIYRSLLPFLPRIQDQIELDRKTYIVNKIMYGLSVYRDGNVSTIHAKVVVRRKTDNDY